MQLRIMGNSKRKLKAGDWVEVRSKEEILQTLDSNGRLDGMPFMPEMFAFCGKRFRVYKRAHKTCDTVFPVRGRRVERTVHLETRCTGAAHGGCEAECLIFWKEAWLRSVHGDAPRGTGSRAEENEQMTGRASSAGCAEAAVWAGTQVSEARGGEVRYVCQATQLPYATKDLSWWDVRQYLEDYTSGNAGLWRMICGLTYSIFYNLSQAGIGLGRPMRWLYDRFHPLWAGPPFPRKTGTIPTGQPTPAATLNLQPGELVRIRPHEAILQTVSGESKNRGMYWDAEMVPYCGGTYRVHKRVTRIIDERTGKMQSMKTPGIMLDSVVCQSRYSGCRMFCPRSIYPYWREIWLERVEPNGCGAREAEAHSAVKVGWSG
jgi:hypothetical protein